MNDKIALQPLQTFAALIPVRILNEFVYCPRLAYMMWVQGEFAHNADTVEGRIRHKRVDQEKGRMPEAPETETRIHASSVALSSERLGITAKIDLVEGDGKTVVPVDYKKGKRPHVAAGAYAPERVQVCAQGLLLREHGFSCEQGVLYFHGSRERVPVQMDDELIAETMAAVEGLRALQQAPCPPEPLEDSPKCSRCSLIGICLPDEMRFLHHCKVIPRPVFAGVDRFTSSHRVLTCARMANRSSFRKSGKRSPRHGSTRSARWSFTVRAPCPRHCCTNAWYAKSPSPT